MKKAEMESHRAEYRARLATAKAAEGRGLYREALTSALSAWEFIDGMMQYEKRYCEGASGSIAAIDLVLMYAPLLFDRTSLNTLEQLLKEYRRIQRDTEVDVGQKLDEARAGLWENHRLWTHMERHGDVRQDELRNVLGGSQERWRALAEAWDVMGLVQRTPERGSYRIGLATRLGQVVRGKCPACGEVSEAPKSMFLERMRCPECRTKVEFVLLA